MANPSDSEMAFARARIAEISTKILKGELGIIAGSRQLMEFRVDAALDYAIATPRLPSRLIFYPVLDEEYAVEIARDWNTRDEVSGFVGYVTRFEVDSDFIARYEVQRVGASRHRELWVLAEELQELNDRIVGRIEVVARYHPDR